MFKVVWKIDAKLIPLLAFIVKLRRQSPGNKLNIKQKKEQNEKQRSEIVNTINMTFFGKGNYSKVMDIH